jgi:hypothetical protein
MCPFWGRKPKSGKTAHIIKAPVSTTVHKLYMCMMTKSLGGVKSPVHSARGNRNALEYTADFSGR